MTAQKRPGPLFVPITGCDRLPAAAKQAVFDVARAFADTWAETGPPLPARPQPFHPFLGRSSRRRRHRPRLLLRPPRKRLVLPAVPAVMATPQGWSGRTEPRLRRELERWLSARFHGDVTVGTLVSRLAEALPDREALLK